MSGLLEGKRILVCAPLPPSFDREGGSKRIHDILRLLRRLGASVTFVAERMGDGERYIAELQQLGIASFTGFGQSLRRMIRVAKYDAAILAFWYVAERIGPVIREESPGTKILVDSIDLHFLRLGRARIGEEGRLDMPFGAEMVREINVYAAADTVLTVSAKEAQLVSDLTASKPRALALPDIETGELSLVPRQQRRGCVFIGNFKHPPNVDALQLLCQQIVPLLPASLLQQQPIQVVGNALEDVDAVRRGELPAGVVAVGWVPEVEPYLQQASISLLPLRYGAGTKRKLIQAMLAGTPSVTTSIGAEGLGIESGRQALVADTPAAFAAAMQRLLEDAPLWEAMRLAGREHALAGHGEAMLEEQLAALFG